MTKVVENPAALDNSPERRGHVNCGRASMAVHIPGQGWRIQPLRCESWSCVHCKKGNYRKWIGRCKAAFAAGWKPDTLVTVTIDPKKLKSLGKRPALCKRRKARKDGKPLQMPRCLLRGCCNPWEGIATDYLLQRKWFTQKLRMLFQRAEREIGRQALAVALEYYPQLTKSERRAISANASRAWRRDRRYIRAYEAQRRVDGRGRENGRLHAHILVDCPLRTAGTKPPGTKGRRFAGRDDVGDWWHQNAQRVGFGFHSESLTLRKTEPYTDSKGRGRLPDAVGYLFKYLMKGSREAYRHRIRMIQPSNGFPKGELEVEAQATALELERKTGERVFARRLTLHRGEVFEIADLCGLGPTLDKGTVVLSESARLPFELFAFCPEWLRGVVETGHYDDQGYQLPSGEVVSTERGTHVSLVHDGRFLFRVANLVLSEAGAFEEGVPPEETPLWDHLLVSSLFAGSPAAKALNFHARSLAAASSCGTSRSSSVPLPMVVSPAGALEVSLVNIQRTARLIARSLDLLISEAARTFWTSCAVVDTSTGKTMWTPLDVCDARETRDVPQPRKLDRRFTGDGPDGSGDGGCSDSSASDDLAAFEAWYLRRWNGERVESDRVRGGLFSE